LSLRQVLERAPVEALLLDAYNTSLRRDPLRELATWLSRIGAEQMTPEAFHRAVIPIEELGRTGSIDETEYAQRLVAETGVEVDGETACQYLDLRRAIAQRFCRFYDHVLPLLQCFLEQGGKVVVVTDTAYTGKRLAASKFGDHNVTGMVCSCDTGTTKEDVATYRRACELAGVAPDHCLAVDDDPLNILTARQIGVRGVVIDNPEGMTPFRVQQGRVTRKGLATEEIPLVGQLSKVLAIITSAKV
jgi:HAD superfamily hydrolase (TIGR01509 family)